MGRVGLIQNRRLLADREINTLSLKLNWIFRCTSGDCLLDWFPGGGEFLIEGFFFFLYAGTDCTIRNWIGSDRGWRKLGNV